jgi:hypothetical protein
MTMHALSTAICEQAFSKERGEPLDPSEIYFPFQNYRIFTWIILSEKHLLAASVSMRSQNEWD